MSILGGMVSNDPLRIFKVPQASLPGGFSVTIGMVRVLRVAFNRLHKCYAKFDSKWPKSTEDIFFLKLKLPWIYNRCCWQIWVLQFHVIITDVCEFWYDTEKMTANDFKSIMIKYYEEVNPSIKTFVITTRKDRLHNFWKQNKMA